MEDIKSMKTDLVRRINRSRSKVIEFKPQEDFIDNTKEAIFHHWIQHDYDELYLAEKYDVGRRQIEAAIKVEVRRRLKFPPVFPVTRRAA